MNIEVESVVSGKIEWLEVRDRNGKLKARIENIPNIIINSGLTTAAELFGAHNAHTTHTSTADSYDDLGGTWNQTGNTVTRATGASIFPSSPSHVDNELYWYDAGANTGHRCHVTARASDTSITVSGPARTITGGKLRRFLVNGQLTSWYGAAVQSSASVTTVSTVYDYAAGTLVRTYRANFNSAVSGYSLGSIIMAACARVKLPAPIAIDAEDQLTYQYVLTETCGGRSQDYELGAESVGIPQRHSMLSIVGNGTNVDVTFSAATHFLAGDKLDLRGVTPKKFAISSASSTSTTLTINTTVAHGLNVGDSVVVEGASLAGYNGTFTVATVPDADTITITDASNPGAMGASGTVRLATPATYFDDLGLATIASMVSSSVARITSAITGPAVEPAQIGGDPGVKVRFWPRTSASSFAMGYVATSSALFTEANSKAIADPATPAGASETGAIRFDSVTTLSSASPATDFTNTVRLEWNAGAGKSITRCKQVMATSGGSIHQAQVTFNTPWNKETTQRLRVNFTKQIKRTLDLTGLP